MSRKTQLHIRQASLLFIRNYEYVYTVRVYSAPIQLWAERGVSEEFNNRSIQTQLKRQEPAHTKTKEGERETRNKKRYEVGGKSLRSSCCIEQYRIKRWWWNNEVSHPFLPIIIIIIKSLVALLVLIYNMLSLALCFAEPHHQEWSWWWLHDTTPKTDRPRVQTHITHSSFC